MLRGGGIIKTIASSGINAILEELKEIYPERLFLKIENKFYNLRKLTPWEYLKFMGWSQKDADLICNNIPKIQVYKLAGNAIVLNVIKAILKNLLKGYKNENN